jgi:asparagine synthase (glutamine-hydrolysing)
MLSDDGRYSFVYNGEVYNFLEVRKRLESLGIAFRGRSDSEVVFRAFIQWGPKAFAEFNGMFGFAVWDREAKTLHLARDRFGIKPLFYHLSSSGIVFGSEIKSILASGRVDRRLNWRALHEYLYYGASLGEGTFFEGVLNLLPGRYLIMDRDGSRVEQYASIDDVEPISDGLDDATAKVHDLLDASVRRHLVSDVPVGVFLSGGIDSSAITALASKHYGGSLRTFSVGFDFDRGVNELPKAQSVADAFHTDHTELHIAGRDLPGVIERLVRCHDEPFGDVANIPLYLLCEELRGEVKVVLQGDGGDEIFGGYRRYGRLEREKWFRRLGGPLAAALSMLGRNDYVSRGLKTVRALRHSDESLRMALLMSQEPINRDPQRVFSDDARESLDRSDPFERYRDSHRRYSRLDSVQRMLYTDSSIILPDVYFEKVDRATMAHGIEVRVPMVDVDLAAYAMGLPADFKVRRGQKKYILRRALRGVVPDHILDGPKTGFGVPFQFWLRAPLAEYMRSVLLDSSVQEWGIFDRTALERCMEEHTSGRRDNGFLLNKVLNLALWHRFYLA